MDDEKKKSSTHRLLDNKRTIFWLLTAGILIFLINSIGSCSGCSGGTEYRVLSSDEVLNIMPFYPYNVEMGKAVFFNLNGRWSRWIDASSPPGTYWRVISDRGHQIQFKDGTVIEVPPGEDGADSIPGGKREGFFRLKSLDGQPAKALIRLSRYGNFPRYQFF